jgi:phage terminase large subunit-like protein
MDTNPDAFVPIAGYDYGYDYAAFFRRVLDRPAKVQIQAFAELAKQDLFFLLVFGLRRRDVNRPWIVDRIREVEACHNNTMDLWAREHYKSTVITLGLVIQDLCKNPEERIGIFSHTRPIAKGFLRQIKLALESDCPIKKWFPHVFWMDPKKHAPKWSEDDGLIVRRRGQPKESSIEAWGLVDGQPTSKHFTIRVYDDVVTKESVTTPEMIKKTRDAFELSQSLGTDGGQVRICGTHYHFADLYTWLKTVPVYTVRQYPATADGTPTGNPVLMSRARLEELRVTQGPYVFSCQQLLNPVADGEQNFQKRWLRWYATLPTRLNRYLVADPANEKGKKSDYTVIAVVGVDASGNRYLLDMVRARLSLGERWAVLRDMVAAWPGLLKIGYEKYGMQADIAYFEERQRAEGFYFAITPLAGAVAKIDRIRRLVPVCEDGRFYLPPTLLKAVKIDGTMDLKQDAAGVWRQNGTPATTDMIRQLVEEEYSLFPFSGHDDMMDCLSRIEDPDMGVRPPAQECGQRQAFAEM